MNNIIDNYAYCFSRYIDFHGRADRAEFWNFFIIKFIIAFILGLFQIPLLVGIFSLIVLLPSLSVNARRLHDIDFSAWWLLLALIPVVGNLILLIMAALPGSAGANSYGAKTR